MSWVLLLGASVAVAQEATEEELEETRAERDADDSVEEIIVTGSRIRRDAFTAALPVTIITADRSVLAGLTDAGEILQASALASGTQIDNSFGGYVVSGGPGVNSFGLRSLNANRTLVLVNGRRFTPAGVRGRINNFDLNAIPGIAIQRIEILKDGASAVYGADAVAGVVNIITRKQFDEFSINVTGDEGEENHEVSISYGKTFDRGYIDFAAQYSRQDPIKRNKFRWSECIERPLTGGGQHPSLFAGATPDSPQKLLFRGPEGQPAYPGRCFGRLYGFIDAGIWFGYSEEQERFAEILNPDDVSSLDADSDGVADTDNRMFGDPIPFATIEEAAYRDNRNSSTEDLVFGERLFQVYSDGAWDFDLDSWGAVGDLLGTVTGSFEFYFTRRANTISSDYRYLFQSISARNPTNKIGAALGYEYLTERLVDADGNPVQMRDDDGNLVFVTDADGNQVTDDEGNPMPVFATRPGDPINTEPVILAYEILSPLSNAEVDTVALRGALDGDLGNFKWQLNLGYSFTRGQWDYETFVRDRVARALSSEIGPNGELQCALDEEQIRTAWYGDQAHVERILDDDGNVIRDPECVPLDLFTRDALLNGRLPADAKEYIVDHVENKSEYDLFTVDFNVEGALFDLPAGEVRGSFGLEWRSRELDDRPPQVSADDNQWGFSSSGRTMGDDEVSEAFVELDFPLLAGVETGGVSVAEELTLNTSYRFTDYSSYGSDSTYRILLNWSINPTARIRTSFGTSFRAPALYELYLADESAFPSGQNDPCTTLTPDDEFTTVGANCAAVGIPFDSGFGSSSLRAISGGNPDLEAETSESLTVGLVLTPSLKDWLPRLGMDVSVAFDYYDIELENSIAQLDTDDILDRCYGSDGFNAPECFLIANFDPTTGGRSGDANELNDIRTQFLNIAKQRSTGYDITLRADREFSFGDLEVDLVVSRLLAYQEQLTSISDVNDYSGYHSFADWRGELDVRLAIGDWSMLWRTRYISDTTEDPVWPSTAERGDARSNVHVADDVFFHTFAVNYEDPQDRFEVILGVANVFNQDPPVLGWNGFDPTEEASLNYNIPLGSGYDLFPRRLYATVEYKF